MATAPTPMDLEALVTRLAATGDAGTRARLLAEAAQRYPARDLAECLKEEADRARYQDLPLAYRWSDDIITLGTLAGAPTVIALGRMVEAFTLYTQGRFRDSLSLFDEASDLFRANGDEIGWARTQIGRIAPCIPLALLDEALERGHQARTILEEVGDTLRVASIDNNLAMFLHHMNRPAEALSYSERAVAAYRTTGLTHHAIGTLCNHALLLWQLGYVRESLAVHHEARQAYATLGAKTDAARQDMNIGRAYLALSRYAEATQLFLSARSELLAADIPYVAATAGLQLAESYIRLGRFQDAIELSIQLQDEFARCEAPVDIVQTLTWRALGYSGLQEYDAALRTLDEASAFINADDNLSSYRATINLSRAQSLLQAGRCREAGAALEQTIPELLQAGLGIETTTAQLLWAETLIGCGDIAGAQRVIDSVLTTSEAEGLAGLAVHIQHLRGRVELLLGNPESAQRCFEEAMNGLDLIHRFIAWDDRAAFAGTASTIYADALSLAIEREEQPLALYYSERVKARALADHLQAHIDIRPRDRDSHSGALIEELTALRERYAWLGTRPLKQAETAVPAAKVRWAIGTEHDTPMIEEARQIERRIAAIWRELQVSNPAYGGEMAALDLAAQNGHGTTSSDEAMAQWLERLHTQIGYDGQTALVEYAARGDDLIVFVLRASHVYAVTIPKAGAHLRRLVPFLRLNIDRSAASITQGRGLSRGLASNARGILQQLHATLLDPAMPWLDGVSRLVIVPHSITHHVPFHALYDGSAYLLEKTEIGYVPCASLIEHFNERYDQMRTGDGDRQREALVLSNSGGGALAHVTIEGQTVAGVLGGRHLQEDEATVSAVRNLSGSCSVLHIASHGVFRPDASLFSALHLHDGQLSTLDIFDLELRCSLATLSACETSLGVSGAGDELMGLSRALLYAGAPSLILSLWKVEDRSTALLMEQMYRALQSGATKAAALRQAQLALLRAEVGDAADFSAPFFWAPFQLIGHMGAL